MSRKYIIGIFIFFFISVFAFFSFSQIKPIEVENEPDWLTLPEAMQLASSDERLIFVDIYEVGCQWCRKMTREVFPSPTVRAVLDRDFHPVKLNGNSSNRITFKGQEMSEQEFASMMGVTAFPFSVVLDSDGNVIDRRRGYMDIQGFARFLRNAVESKS